MLLYVSLFLKHALFSLFTEGLVAGFLARFSKKNPRRFMLVAAVGTALTIPYVWFVFPTLFYASPLFIVAIGEAFAVVAETLLYRYAAEASWKFALACSCIANAASYIVGQLVW